MSEAVDGEHLRQKQALLAQIAAWGSVGALIGVGARLGLYAALEKAGPTTAGGLALATGLKERLLLEWLRGQAAAGVLEYDGRDQFHISPEVASLLAHEEQLSYAGYPFLSLPVRLARLDHVVDAFRTGVGFGWDDLGTEAVATTERARRNWFRQELIPNALPLMPGMVARLAAGAKVADVGCGAGVALIEMASHFPRSSFQGFEVSDLSLKRAAENRDASGAGNVSFHNAVSDPLPRDASFDLIMTIDCLHDMTHPEDVAASVRRALRPDGTWFILDFDSEPSYEANVKKNPVRAAGSYSGSVLMCLQSSLSEAGGMGLGTLGLPEPAMRALAEGAGFRQFRRLGTSGVWAMYEARP